MEIKYRDNVQFDYILNGKRYKKKTFAELKVGDFFCIFEDGAFESWMKTEESETPYSSYEAVRLDGEYETWHPFSEEEVYVPLNTNWKVVIAK